jgi:uncharacterized repeat protein (TIGR03843 family)
VTDAAAQHPPESTDPRPRDPGRSEPARGTDGLTVARRLATAPMEVVGRFADASNATLLVRLTDRDERSLEQLAVELDRDPSVDDLDPEDLAVYKPQRGEAPLWDFPSGTLHRREIAAHEVSAALGWDLVPTTVLRVEGPFGVGSLQRFVPHDPGRHYFTLVEEGDADIRHQLVAMVLFDLVIDNADRKGGHVLLAEDGRAEGGPARVQLVDHGVSFNTVRKLRTVGWDFAGDPVPFDLRADLDALRGALAGELGARLTVLLSEPEVEILVRRTVDVLASDVLPEPTGNYPYPWPLL